MSAARGLCFVALGLLAAASAGATAFDTNLVVNGGAESDAAGPSGYEVVPSVSGWTRSGNLTLVSYATGGGFPVLASPGPAQRGTNFFAGGPDAPASALDQVVDVADLAAAIDAGAVRYRLAGYLGGYASQGDHARFLMTLRDGALATLGSVQLGPVSYLDRGSQTGLLLRAAQGTVPAGTRSIALQLACTRLDGSYNDGYADSLTLVLSRSTTGVGPGAAAALEFSPVTPNPSRAGVRFAFRLARDGDVRLEVFDPSGRRAARVLDGALPAGDHAVSWSLPVGVRPGVYHARLASGGDSRTRRFVVLE